MLPMLWYRFILMWKRTYSLDLVNYILQHLTWHRRLHALGWTRPVAATVVFFRRNAFFLAKLTYSACFAHYRHLYAFFGFLTNMLGMQVLERMKNTDWKYSGCLYFSQKHMHQLKWHISFEKCFLMNYFI